MIATLFPFAIMCMMLHIRAVLRSPVSKQAHHCTLADILNRSALNMFVSILKS